MVGKIYEEGCKKLRELGMGFYLDTRAETGSTVRINREYIDSLTIEMRIIDTGDSSTETAYFGEKFQTPIMTGALSHLNAICEEPLAKIAQGAKVCGAVNMLGIGDSAELESVIATGAKVAKIVKPYKDEDLIYAKLKEAEEMGAFAVGMDVSFGFGGKRGDQMNRANIMAPKSVRQLESYIGTTKLPFIMKGVLSRQDAEKSLEAGAAALVVSSHSGSALDYAVPPLKILPGIAELVKGKAVILVDGGIVRGSDVFKALALGADGVLMGRAVMAALAAEGASGVVKYLQGVNEELKRIMGITGCRTIGDIEPGLIWGK